MYPWVVGFDCLDVNQEERFEKHLVYVSFATNVARAGSFVCSNDPLPAAICRWSPRTLHTIVLGGDEGTSFTKNLCPLKGNLGGEFGGGRK